MQLKYENARRQLEIARQQNAETKVSHGHLDEREKALQAQETALKQKEEEVQKRESELIKPQKSSASDSIPVKVLESFGQRQQKLVLQHQDLMARERQK